jgi:phosphoglycolate phosphatase-like HAD superfamily hydrolase
MVREIQSLATNESEDALYALVREFVFRLTGKQTIYQMMQLAEEVRKRGGSASSPEEYKAMYHALLWREVEGRVQGLRSGTIAPVDLLVQGSIDLLDALQERGVRLYLASGTDIGYVRDEADALGLSGYFGEHIYGALTRREDFSKRMVIRRILGEQGLSGAELVAFGDGYVEIEDACRAGGRTVGVASDEARPGMLDSWKRNRLISAGADIIVPAYAEAERLLDWIENGLQPGSPREHR